MENFKKYTILSLAILIVGIIAMGITYAFFTSTITSDVSNLASSGKLDVIYISEANLEGTLYPTSDYRNGLSTTASIRMTNESVAAQATFTLNIIDLPQVLAVFGLKWEVYENDDLVSISSGTFLGVSEGDNLVILEDYQLSTEPTLITLYIWLDGDEVGNEVQNQTFDATLVASATTIS